MDDEDFEMLTLHGSWARERQIERRPIAYGKQSVSSLRGESSHQDHPFMAWMTKGTDQTTGDVYGMHFVYSGNFIAQIEKSQFDSIRAVMGIHSEGLSGGSRLERRLQRLRLCLHTAMMDLDR